MLHINKSIPGISFEQARGQPCPDHYGEKTSAEFDLSNCNGPDSVAPSETKGRQTIYVGQKHSSPRLKIS